MIRSIVNPGVLATTSDFARVPGSGEVMEATVAGGTTPGTWVPLHDASGSTIALVDPSSGAINTQYSYDPSGVVGTIGAANSYPFLYAGMEYDGATGLYHTGSNYYSPQLTRPLSEVGPTSSRSAGNPSSPTDIPGSSGGGGFTWTFNNVSDQARYSIAAGMGAAGLTAGAAELATVLGIDIGITSSMAGPVGVVVGGLTELGFLIADLLSGGPSIPWEMHAPIHTILGMQKFAGMRDAVDQKVGAARPSGGMPLAKALGESVSTDHPGILRVADTSTAACSEYNKACSQCGDRYDCFVAPFTCGVTPSDPDSGLGRWSNCVRGCLQARRANELRSGCGGKATGILLDHAYCWDACP